MIKMKQQKEIASELNNRIYPILVAQIYKRTSIGILATVVNASILIFVLWEQVLHWKLMSWSAMIILVSLIRIILNLKYSKTVDSHKHIHLWSQLQFFSLGICGVLWGSIPIFLFPMNSTAHQVFIAFVLGGMVAGAVGVFSPIFYFFLTYSIPVLVPITIRFFTMGDEIHRAMGVMTALYAVLISITAKRVNSSTTEHVLLKEKFAGRTAELDYANRTLTQEIEEHKQTESELQETLKKVRTLTGLLPICSSCKKIRDDKGYWNQLEAFITKHSQAEFSHGICPDCAKKFYPDLDIYEDED
jgi:hypothetical protein